MDNGTALPERRRASNTPNDPPDAQAKADSSKPIPETSTENSKPPKAKKEKAPTPSKAKKEPAAKPSVEDPESMFKVGFLSDVYQERPIGAEGISKVITRCKLFF